MKPIISCPRPATLLFSSTAETLLGVLLPQDLREAVMRPCVPLVVTVDATTARIHWEMISLARRHEQFCVGSFSRHWMRPYPATADWLRSLARTHYN